MSNTAVVYATKTKHSKKIAEAIGKSLNVKAENLKDTPSIGQTDILFIVGGIYGGRSLPELLEFVKTLDGAKVKSAVLMTSSASDKTGQDDVHALLDEKGIKLEGEYRCFGGFLVVKLGHPNKSELSKAVDFAVKLARV